MIDILSNQRTWVATTAGERLLFLLLSHHHDWRALAGALQQANLLIGRRYSDLSSFFVGASVLHLQQRLLRLAHDIRDVPGQDRLGQVTKLREKACDVIQITPLDYDGDFSGLIEEVLTAAEQMPKEPPSALKTKVNRSAPCCYSCGRVFGSVTDDAPDGLIATTDHVWPRALGGDSTEGNLLPACQSCNSTKGHMASWHMAWIQPIVFADVDEVHGLQSLTREARMALHLRAAMTYAQQNGSTLKDAFLAIGPREPPVRVDPDQGYDFFNLRVHDEARTNVKWTPC